VARSLGGGLPYFVSAERRTGRFPDAGRLVYSFSSFRKAEAWYRTGIRGWTPSQAGRSSGQSWGGAVGVAPRRPLSYLVRVRVRSLFAGSPLVGENSIVRLSLIEPDFLSAAFPAAVGLSVSLILPALLMESLPL
jgi:hypothetical protein